MKTLIVDDDLAIADVLAFTMRRAGYEVIVANDGITALERWEEHSPDLILLDLNMPRLDGLSVCRRIRSMADTPIIILSVRGEEDDIVTGLNLGADDYIVKPFSPRQVIARVEAVLRRAGTDRVTPGPISLDDITLNPSLLQLKIGQQEIQLTKLECKLMETLMVNHGQVMTYQILIDEIWGMNGGDKVMLKQLVYRLRKKMSDVPEKSKMIQTVPSIGYILKAAQDLD